MIYLGKYYKDLGVNTDLNIPRTDYVSIEDAEALEYKYVLVLVNNITKQIARYDTDNGMKQSSDNPYYYTFTDIDTDNLTDGEYTYTLYEDNVQVASGLLTYRQNAPVNKTVYEKTTEYVVYK